MSILIYAVNGGLTSGKKVFDSAYTLMYADPIRVSHQYFSGGNLCVALNVPSLDFLTFEVTDVVQGPGGQVWVRPATVEEVSARLFIQDGGDAPDAPDADAPIDCSNGCPDHDPSYPSTPTLDHRAHHDEHHGGHRKPPF